MNGVHDMGGMQGFGRVMPEANEPLFHAPWESRAMAVTVAMGASGQWNIDLARSARESLAPAIYLSSSYYEIWIRALEQLTLERGMVTASELSRGQMQDPPRPVARVLKLDTVDAALAAGTPTLREATSPARFRLFISLATVGPGIPVLSARCWLDRTWVWRAISINTTVA